LVVLTGVEAFHRSPCSTLSTETTSVITLTPIGEPYPLFRQKRREGESGVGTEVLSHYPKPNSLSRTGNSVKGQTSSCMDSKEHQNIDP
jgi:hypothetical protein